jgi:molybdate transport system ATP-binding protein
VLEGVITGVDVARGLAELQLGSGRLLVSAVDAHVGARARVQLLARDLILATHPAQGLSVRNSIAGVVRDIRDDENEAKLVTVDIGGASVLARVTRDAVESLALHTASPVWVLVKAVSMRSHSL